MSERSKKISSLLNSAASRASYIRAKLNVLIPSQIRSLRLQRKDMTQKELAKLADMAQPRISAMERPGETTFNIDTLVRLAAAFKVGLKVEFVPFSEMLEWENNYSQDVFNPAPIEQDRRFLNPVPVAIRANLIPARNEFVQTRQAFERNLRTVYTSYTELARSDDILTGVTSGIVGTGVNVPIPGAFTYVGSPSPIRQSTEIQATPLLASQNIIAVASVSHWP